MDSIGFSNLYVQMMAENKKAKMLTCAVRSAMADLFDFIPPLKLAWVSIKGDSRSESNKFAFLFLFLIIFHPHAIGRDSQSSLLAISHLPYKVMERFLVPKHTHSVNSLMGGGLTPAFPLKFSSLICANPREINL